VGGLTELGRGEEARALLDNREIAGHLDREARARLKNNTEALTEAHEKDRIERNKREAAEEATRRETSALAFTANFRPRLEAGEATLAEITGAETEGILSPARAQRLRAEFQDAQQRREQVSARTERISSVLEKGGRLDPEDFDDHDDVAHHYEATLHCRRASARKSFQHLPHRTGQGAAGDCRSCRNNSPPLQTRPPSCSC
jgi:hypothetical protein